MTRSTEGFRSEALRDALQQALAGKPKRLAELASAHGGMPGPRPNLKLAVAFAEEVADLPGVLAPLLESLGAEDAAPSDPRVFLPVLAAHGWAARLRKGREVEPAWAALAELAADSRTPVRIGTLDALITLGMREAGGDELVARAQSFLAFEDRELRFGAASMLIEVLGSRSVLSTLRDPLALLAYLRACIEDVSNAPRAAERSEGRRRVLQALPRTIAAAVTHLRGGEQGMAFWQDVCADAAHPDIRAMLSKAIDEMRRAERSQGAALAESARKALESSAKPIRDPARVRPGTGRGRSSRRTR